MDREGRLNVELALNDLLKCCDGGKRAIRSVVADGLNLRVGRPRQFSYIHDRSLTLQLLQGSYVDETPFLLGFSMACCHDSGRASEAMLCTSVRGAFPA